jgi:hypothetical protein
VETTGDKNINEAVSEKAMSSGWILLNTTGKSQMITDTIFTNEPAYALLDRFKKLDACSIL